MLPQKFLTLALLFTFSAFLTSCEVSGVSTGCGSAEVGQEDKDGYLSGYLSGELGRPDGFTSSDMQAIKAFYAARGNSFVWRGRRGWTKRAQAAFSALQSADREGLSSAQYLAISYGLPDTKEPSLIADAELKLTKAMLAYVRDVRHGRFNPRNSVDGGELLSSGLNAGNFGGWLAALTPIGKTYQELKLALGGSYGSISEKQRKKILINMERQRWRHEQVNGRRIRVNIAGQELEAFHDDRVQLSMNVVVGRSSRKTPALEDQIVNLKFSPDWSVPETIMEKDYLPRLKKDANYASSKGFKVYKNGKSIDASKVDWSKANFKDYQFRKPPGKGNPLGGVRFSLTNGQGIYLHDTIGRNQFNKNTRYDSSGCVRVQNAPALASWVMLGQSNPMSDAEIKKAMKQRKSSFKKLDTPVPVSLMYLTAWVDGAGQLRFAKDSYGHDRWLQKKMGL